MRTLKRRTQQAGSALARNGQAEVTAAVTANCQNISPTELACEDRNQNVSLSYVVDNPNSIGVNVDIEFILVGAGGSEIGLGDAVHSLSPNSDQSHSTTVTVPSPVAAASIECGGTFALRADVTNTDAVGGL